MNYDYNNLLESAAGDEDLAMELIGIFLKEYPEQIEGIQKAVDANQPEELHRTAHKLKGMLSTIGATDSLNQVIALEKMGISNDMAHAQTAFTKLKDYGDVLVNELQEKKKVLN